jgi:hypothetical protein
MHNPDPVADEPIRFNAALDVEAAARTFAQRGRVRIADVLDPLSAARLHRCLLEDVPWRLTYNEGEKSVFLDAAALQELGERKQHELLQRLVSRESLLKVNAQATLYRPGHFLSLHDDSAHPEQHRRVAYVLYMTRGWRADWGGQLQFLDAQGDVEEVWMPRFNSLGLFLVPTPHVVSYVAPFATQPRHAITGWLCDGPSAPATGPGDKA